MNHFPKDVLPVVESMGSTYFHEEQYYQLEKRNKKEESKVFFQVEARVQFISFEILILKMTNKMFQVLFFNSRRKNHIFDLMVCIILLKRDLKPKLKLNRKNDILKLLHLKKLLTLFIHDNIVDH